MSTLLVRAIATSFRRAGFAFSSASTTRLDVRTLTYDQVRALVCEPQLDVSAEIDRYPDDPQQVTGANMREGILFAEAEIGVERARAELVKELGLAGTPATVVAVESQLAGPVPQPVADEPPRDNTAAAAREASKAAPAPAPAKPPKGTKK